MMTWWTVVLWFALANNDGTGTVSAVRAITLGDEHTYGSIENESFHECIKQGAKISKIFQSVLGDNYIVRSTCIRVPEPEAWRAIQ